MLVGKEGNNMRTEVQQLIDDRHGLMAMAREVAAVT